MTSTAPAAGPSEILADIARRKARRRRIFAAILLLLIPPIGLVAWKSGGQVYASTYLGARGYSVLWWVDRENWKRGGTTVAEVTPLVFGFVDKARSPGELRALTWAHRVERLDLSRLEGLRDEELDCLAELPWLTLVNLDQRHGNQWFDRKADRPGDGALAPMRGLVHLRDLNLAGTRITDAGLVHLAGLTEMRILDLGETGITDDGLASLAGLKKLSYLNIRGTRVTPEGAARLKASFPETDVDHESIPSPR